MNIKQLNEVFSIYSDGRFKYADIDAKAVYDNCINKDFGSHTFEEADEFKKFVNITPETDEEQLRALRNTLVKYWADYVKEYKGDDWGRSRSKEESDKEFKMGDQMQFFTTVIDMAIDNLPEDKRIQESLKEDLSDEELDEPNQYCVYIRDEDDRVKSFCQCSSLREAIEQYMELLDYIDEEKGEFVCISEGHDADNRVVRCSLDESKNEEYEITNQDRIDAIREDERDLKNAINGVCNRFEAYSKNWDEEKQQMVQDRIMEIMETAETNLRNMIKRMK